jgi:UDP-N-acetylmuramoylalanine--D-glutamate ligase
MENPMDFVARPVAVVGMGLSGEAALRLLKKNGVAPKDIATFDDQPGKADWHDPQLMIEDFRPKTLVVSPGYPLSKLWIEEFRQEGGFVTSELALAVDYLQGEKVIGVTGSVGKSTVVSALGAALESFSPHSFVGGNIGRPLADYVVDLQESKRKKAEWIVLELSSYQLENCGHLQCDLSAITFLTPNHMDRYRDLNQYYETKWALANITRSSLVLNGQGGDLRSFAKGRSTTNAMIFWTDQADDALMPLGLNEASLLSSHNQDNLAVCAKLMTLAKWPERSFAALRAFPGLPHRMENLGLFKGVRFVNDSKATTIDSVCTAALGLYEGMEKKGSLVLLLGGKDKNLPWEGLSRLSRIAKLKPIFFGAVGPIAQERSGLAGPVVKGLGEAIAEAVGISCPGDLVLLSPGGTSLDQFKSFEERGTFFRKEVERLTK